MQRLSTMTRLLRYAPWQQTILLLCVMLIARMTEGIGLLLLVPMLDSLYGESSPGQATNIFDDILAMIGVPETIGALLILFIALIALRGVLLVAERVLATQYQNRLVDRLRGQLFGQIVRAEWRWLSARRATDHSATLTGGAGRIAIGVNQLVMLTAQLASLLAFVFASFLLSWQVTLCVLAIGAIVHGLMHSVRRRAVTIGHDLVEANRAVQSAVQEALTGARLVKILRGEDRLIERFGRVVDTLRIGQVAYVRSAAIGQMTMQIGGALALAALLYGGRMWLNLPISVLLTVVLVMARLIPVFAAAQQSYHAWLNAMPAFEDYDRLIEETGRFAEAAPETDLPPMLLRSAIEVDGVTVRHEGRDRPALNHATLTLTALSTTLVTGASGAGKSTLADLVMGLIEPDSGQIRVDGVPLHSGARQRWRESVAYVQQDVFLFHDSIRANLLWAKADASDDELEQALADAAATFVYALPDGIDTMVGDSGCRLSGGERQRIALARALLGRPALLILDEATSALDETNKALIRQSLRGLAGQLTLMIIAHRTDGWQDVDQIIVVDAGHVAISNGEKLPA